MVASVEEAESSASSTSSGRHSADLPIVGPPRGLLARVSQEENPFQVFLPQNIYYIIYIYIYRQPITYTLSLKLDIND